MNLAEKRKLITYFPLECKILKRPTALRGLLDFLGVEKLVSTIAFIQYFVF